MAEQGNGSLLVLGPGLDEAFIRKAHSASPRELKVAGESLDRCLETCDASNVGILLVGAGVLPADDSLGVQHWIRLRTFRLVVVTNDKSMDNHALFLRSRCVGVVHSGIEPNELRRMFDTVLGGEYWLPRSVLARAIDELLVEREDGLTKREREVMQLVRRGKPNREIAELLFISKETVRWHLRSIYSKVGYLNRTQLEAHRRSLASAEKKPTRAQPAGSTK